MPKAGVSLSEFEDATPPRKQRCWFERITDEQREKVISARATGYSNNVIAKVVTSWEVPIGESRVRSHFGGNCSCGRP